MQASQRIALVVCALFAVAAQAATETPAMSAEERQRAHEREIIDAAISRGEHGDSAAAVERDLRHSLADVAAPDLTVRDVACGGGYCRVVLVHGTSRAQQDVLQKVTLKPGFRLPGMAHLERTPEGAAISFVYVRDAALDWPVDTAASSP
jgi:hypothetical protein